MNLVTDPNWISFFLLNGSLFLVMTAIVIAFRKVFSRTDNEKMYENNVINFVVVGFILTVILIVSNGFLAYQSYTHDSGTALMVAHSLVALLGALSFLINRKGTRTPES